MRPAKPQKQPQLQLNHLTKPGAPWRHSLIVGKDTLENALLKMNKSHVAVRYVRGSKTPGVEEFFAELSAALQFPHYFGENWDACEDCLCDLTWLGAEALILVFADAPLMLKNASPEDIDTFNSLFDQVLEHWNAPAAAGKPRLVRAVQLVFQAEPGTKPAAMKQWNVA